MITWRKVTPPTYDGPTDDWESDDRTWHITRANYYPNACVHIWHYSNGYVWDHECDGEDCPCLAAELHVCDFAEFTVAMLALGEMMNREQRNIK